MLTSLLSAIKSVSAPVVAALAEPVIQRDTIFSDLSFLDLTDPHERGAHNKAIKDLWRVYVKTNQPSSAQMALRNILLGRDIDRGFSPVTNDLKIKNGQAPYGSLSRTLWEIEATTHPWLPFESLWVSPSSEPSHRARLAKVFGSDEAGTARIKRLGQVFVAARERITALTKAQQPS